jgi:hypothetical protein
VRDVRPLSGRGGVAGVGGGGAGREHAENGCGGAEDPKYSRHAGSFLAPPKSADGFGLEVARPTPGRRLHPVRSRWVGRSRGWVPRSCRIAWHPLAGRTRRASGR